MPRYALTLALLASAAAAGDAPALAPTAATPARALAPSRAAGEKISRLLADWKAAAEESRALPAGEREKIRARIASMAGECPVGRRIEPTVLAARDVLAAFKAFGEAHMKDCPLARATPEERRTEAFAEGEALGEAHHRLAEDLLALATFAAGCPGDAGKGHAAAAPEAGTVCAANPSTCRKDLAARLGKIEASWGTVGEDLAKFPASRGKELRAEYESLARTSRTVTLFPPTVIALSEGFDALVDLEGKLGEWARAHPEITGSVPGETRAAFDESAALVRRARDILRRAADGMRAGEAESRRAAAGAGETARRN